MVTNVSAEQSYEKLNIRLGSKGDKNYIIIKIGSLSRPNISAGFLA